ncbi:efflux RND transporter periplasmic adaptor subunit [Pseudobdellovibrio exovorus]|uniref:Macrolide-specific efflux protein n=1 Tax=Pseudobdellovibrio exovorus JSS TaxID=1184267 RepID=M4VE83_9BACT|nr:efflux RND transporter periplasmic adaptor subunit [Pseudobdellovibrio exovorus]AGH96351.1 macrolide-specific efflux protein [Pseudobdellovibrio exovorus JSS]
MNKKYVIISLVLAILIAGGVWFFFFKAKPTQYREAEIKKSDIALKILATGTVQPENRLQIKSPLAGRAESINVREGQKVKKGEILAWVSSTERAVLLDGARAQGEAEVRKWEEIYKPTPIIAPLAGTIILRSIEPGQTFTTADAILVMADRLTIQAQVDETDLAQIFVKQKAEVVLDAYLNKPLEAVVSHIAYEAKTVNNVTTYTVYVLPLEEIDFLRSGMTANVNFIGESKQDITVVPNAFVKYEAGRPYVLVKTGKEPENRPIRLGITDGKQTEVLSGLNAGDIVVEAIVAEKKNTSSGGISFGGPPGGRRR